MAEIMLNLSAWIERRADNLKPYADHIIHSVKAYEAEIERLRRPEAAQVRVKRDLLSECIHTAFRRASDHPSAEKAHEAISELPDCEWANIISFVETYALEPDTGQVRCAECTCERGGDDCDWIKSKSDTATGWQDISTESKAVEALQQLKDNATGQWVPSSVVHAIVNAALPPAPEKEG